MAAPETTTPLSAVQPAETVTGGPGGPAGSPGPAGPLAVVLASRRGRAATGIAGLLLGVVAIVVATAGMTSTTSEARIALGLVGLVALYYGGKNVAISAFGDKIEFGLWLAVGWMGLLIAGAALVGLLPVGEARNPSLTLTEPTLGRPSLFTSHPLGTDRQGLDILGQLLYGARVSLIVGIGAVLIGGLIGGLIGLLAGFYRGRTDSTIGLLTDSMLAFPPLILLLAIVAMRDPSVGLVTVALAVLSIPTYIRLARANTLVFTEREFVLTARAMGARNRRLLFRELAPNVGPALVAYSFIVAGALIVAEAALSFLGLSIQRPEPTWGNMISAGQSEYERHPHLVFIPATVLFITVFCLNRIGERARQLWDPRESKL